MKAYRFVLVFALHLGISPVVWSAENGHHHSAGHGHAETHGHEAGIGEPGNPASVDRTVQVSMSDAMRYRPASVTVKAGDTVRFVVTNKGTVKHEFGLGTHEQQLAHAEMMKSMPDMKHEDADVIVVEPGRQETLVWKFTGPGTFEFACHVPGHYEAGMIGRVRVEPGS